MQKAKRIVRVFILRYDVGMRVTISLPDGLFKSADALAKELDIPRSQLYARALGEFVAKWRGSDVTARLNAVYGEEEGSIDPAIRKAQAGSVRTSQ